MKYENFPEAKRIVEEIRTIEDKIDALNLRNQVEVKIVLGYHTQVFYVREETGTPYQTLAGQFFDAVIQQYADDMHALKQQLEKL